MIFDGIIGITDLKASGVLADFDDAQLEEMTSYGEFLKVPAGEVLIEAGQPQNCFYIVLKGRLTVLKIEQDGSEIPLGDVGEGESLGEMSMLDDKSSDAAATVRAAIKSIVWQMSGENFLRYIEKHPQAALKLTRALAVTVVRRLRNTIDQVSTGQDNLW